MATPVNEASTIHTCSPTSSSLGRIIPTDLDVLLGKGTPINNHQGNKKFRQLIKKNHERYDNATDGNKQHVARDIVDFLYRQGSRFLQKTDGVWNEVPASRAYAKAQQTLRDGAPKRRERKYQQLREHKRQAGTTLRVTVSTPPPQESAVVVSPVASPTSFLPLESSSTTSVPNATLMVPVTQAFHPIVNDVVLDDHHPFSLSPDSCSVSDEELEAIILVPVDTNTDDDDLLLLDEDDMFCSRTCVERSLLSDDDNNNNSMCNLDDLDLLFSV